MSAERLRQAAVALRAEAETWEWRPRAIACGTAEWLDDIATRHAPSTDQLDLFLHHGYDDEECEVCESGGHPSTVCEGCFPSWEGMDGHVVYPCAETKRALALADLTLGAES